MNVLHSSIYRRVLMLSLPFVMLVLAACKIELTNEIWMNQDNSGRAKVVAEVGFANIMGAGEDSTLTTDNALENYIQLVDDTPGATLISQSIDNNSTAEDIDCVYTVEFSYNNLATLNKILASADKPVIKKQKNEIIIYPKLFSAIGEEDLSNLLGNESIIEVNHHLIFHTPAKIKANSGNKSHLVDNKTLKWDFVVNADWQSNPQPPIKIKY